MGTTPESRQRTSHSRAHRRSALSLALAGCLATVGLACGGPLEEEGTTEDEFLTIGGGGWGGTFCSTSSWDAPDTLACAATLPLSVSRTGYVSASDQDWYKFHTSSGGAFAVACGNSGATCTLRDQSGAALHNSFSDAVLFQAAPGTTYIQVSHNSWGSRSYGVIYTPANGGGSGGQQTAGSIPPGQTGP